MSEKTSLILLVSVIITTIVQHYIGNCKIILAFCVFMYKTLGIE